MKLDLTSRLDGAGKTNLRLATDQSVASLARPMTPLSINSPITKAIEALRQGNLDRYPVVSGNRLICMLSEADLASLLLPLSPEEQDEYRLLTLVNVVDRLIERSGAPALLHVSQPIDSAFSFFKSSPEQSVVGVVDQQGGYYGVLCRADLLAGCFRTLAPTKVGGMATPLGVYLTDGIDSGGVGAGALMLAGATLMCLLIIASDLSNWLMTTAVNHRIDIFGDMIRILMPIMPNYAPAFVNDLQIFAPFMLMLLLLRSIPVAGYHAAEHQVVHCIERGEPLLPERVAAMPRPHPRCGTNLVSAVTLFGFYFSAFTGLLHGYSEAIVPSAIATALTWRQVGTFLQQYFTTRKASPKQIASGIAAGEDLLRKYRQNTNRRINLPMRIWRMGILQMLLGCVILGVSLWALQSWVPAVRPFLPDIY